MKKIVLGCAAVLLSLGLLAGCNKKDDIIEPGPEVGGSGTVVYVFGVESSGTMYYITGEVNPEHTYDGVVTTSLSEAVTIEYTVENNNTYYISFEKSGTTYWITTEPSGTYVNLAYSTTKTPIYLHTSGSSEYFGEESGEHFLSYYYSSLYCSSTTYLGTNEAFGIYQEDGTLVAGGKSVSSSSSSGSGSGSGSTTGSATIPEVSGDTYTLEVGTATIMENFKTSDNQDFTIGSGTNPDATCQVAGETFTFADVFTLSFAAQVEGTSAPSRIWSHGIRVYGGNSFTISACTGWQISSVVLAIYANSDSLTITVSAGEDTLATSSDGSTITVTPTSGVESVVTSLSGTAKNVEFSAITVTATKAAS